MRVVHIISFHTVRRFVSTATVLTLMLVSKHVRILVLGGESVTDAAGA